MQRKHRQSELADQIEQLLREDTPEQQVADYLYDSAYRIIRELRKP